TSTTKKESTQLMNIPDPLLKLFLGIGILLIIILGRRYHAICDNKGYLRLTYPLTVRLIALAIFLVFSFIGNWLYELSDEAISSLIIASFLIVLTLILNLETWFTEIRYNTEEIISRTLFGGTKELLWKNISSISQPNDSDFLTLEDHRHQQIRIHRFLSGFPQFKQLAQDWQQVGTGD
ncbi:MAG: hypothetical protein ACQKBY_12995, partial [Verrucomicrobiales bacterium]